ncbi:hypothetical protein CYMTET_18815 [Cymbomonas tetramitiformis]|uniref:Uncharacterized protein n=1 Tax=Cymbomonas tetramitiformis TaxID=36881 RepID=A0AAE0G7B5_9CHLO|nr:hypothetical protein CYMTET_18815 [Cymbomonas tetramitiformis]
MARAEVVRAAVMIMMKMHGRDGEGDERLTRASTVMKAMTVSAATVPAWTSVHGRDGEGDEQLTRASTVMEAMTASAATVPAWTSVNGRDEEGDERLTMASTLMKVMTVSAATVPAWASVSAVTVRKACLVRAVGVAIESTVAKVGWSSWRGAAVAGLVELVRRCGGGHMALSEDPGTNHFNLSTGAMRI